MSRRGKRGEGEEEPRNKHKNCLLAMLSHSSATKGQQSYNQNHAEISFNLLLNRVLFFRLSGPLFNHLVAGFQEGSFPHIVQLVRGFLDILAEMIM